MPASLYDSGFGVEIECYLPDGSTMQAAAAAITARINKLVNVVGYNHATPPANSWKVTTDGSLGNYTRGIEAVSSILRGPEGIAEVEKVIRALSDFGCTVNKQCGFHIHVGAGERGHMAPHEINKRLINIYAAFEPVIDSLMPPSRRGSNNNFCKSMTSISPAAVNAATTLETFNAAIGRRDRFHKLNVVPAWQRHKTVEFRQHSGTMEPSKIRFWILTCLRMVAAARNGAEIVTATLAQQAAGQSVNRARHGSKSWQIGQMMLRPEGVTGPEAREAVGWPSVSMPDQARICGLTFTTQRIGRSIRYFARAAQAEVTAHVATSPTPITLLGFCDLIGSDASEREYLLQRQADLGGPISWAA